MQTRKIFATVFTGLCRFIGGAIFGGFISLVLFFVLLRLSLYDIWYSWLVHALWLLPLGWGIAAIFLFDRMLDVARDIAESFFRGS